MATAALMINSRYQVKGKPIGQGGMGVVYRAYDTVTKRDVALKTMRGALNSAALELFSKEWSVLARISHPNIIDILDTGEFEQDGERKPFFVMPLLPGATLGHLIETASTRLVVDRIVGIATQTCRGLQAAHEQGLIHRDLKPSNIFVMDDDTVKIIDFGVVHLAGSDSIKGIKGTLQYMAPEQIEMKPASPAFDIFSLGVVCYLALTGRNPFARKTESETIDAIRRHIPPPVCELNPLVSQIVSRVIHKAMAKDPWHRFSTAREFSDTLQKALNGQPIERFDRERIQPRIERAKKAQMEGDHQFASDILTELEAEGNIDPEMTVLRIQLDQAIRQKSIRQLLDTARTRLEEEEFPLALQKIQEVLGIDPDNADALGLRKQIEKQRSEQQAQNWFRLVEQHLHNHAFDQAKQALEEILKLNPKDNRAREMLVEVEQREQETNRLRAEEEKLYQSAVKCYQNGEVSSALSKLERVLELHRQSPDSAIPDRDAQYQSLYNQIRTEREAARSSYAEGRRHLADRNFGRALELCAEFLKKSPGDPMFQALKLEAEEQQRQEQSAFIAEVARRIEAEADLDRRVNILKEASERYPDEPHFQQSLRLVRERRDLVNSIVGKARQYEERGQFNEALSQFDILRNIYAQYPGIEFEAERLKRRRDEQVREEAKGRWVEQIDRNIATGDYVRARDLVRTAIAEFPNDRELSGLERLIQQALERAAEAEEWLQRGQKLCFDRQFSEGLEALRKAGSLDNRNAVIRAALLNALVEQARSVLGQDWRAAEPLIEQALNIDAGHPLARSLQDLVLDYKRQEIVNDCVAQVREMQANGDLRGALAKVDYVLASYPNEVRLVQLRRTLQNLGAVAPAGVAPAPLPNESSASPNPEEPLERQMETRSVTGNRPSVADYSVVSDRAKAAAPSQPQTAPIAKEPAPVVRAPNETWSRIRKMVANAGSAIAGLPRILQSWAEPHGHLSRLQWALIGAAPILLIMAFLVTSRKRHPDPPPPLVPSEYYVDVESNVANAEYRVDTKSATPGTLRLPPGSHTVEAFLTGYKPDKQTITLAPGVAKPFVVSLKLEPEPLRLHLSSGLKSGQASLDGQPPVDLQDGGYTNEAIAPSGDHTFSLTQGNAKLEFSFRAEAGRIVNITPPVKAKDLDTVVIASLGARARVYASDPALKGGLNQLTPQTIPLDGLDLGEITANAELKLDDGKSPRTLPLEIGNAPTLTIWLASDPNLGTLALEVRVTGAEAVFDKRKPRSLNQGKNYFGAEPGTHTLHITRDGFDAIDRKFELKKGPPFALLIDGWKPVIRTSSLLIEGATRDAEVLIDGNARGRVNAEGVYSLNELPPGPHVIILRKADFEEKQLSRVFTVGQSVHISGAEAQLTAFGTLEFRVFPPNASITYRRADEGQARAAENVKVLHVRAGSYVVTAIADGYLPHQPEMVTVEPGKSLPIVWTLSRVDTTPPPPLPPTPTSHFQDPGAWIQDGASWAHKSPDIGWMRAKQGMFEMEFRRQTSKKGLIFVKTRRVDWVADYKDARNFVEYSFDFGSLVRQAIVNGKTLPKADNPLPSGKASGSSYTLQIEIGAEQIVIRDPQGRELDRYPRPNRTAPLGKFGFKGELVMDIKKAEER